MEKVMSSDNVVFEIEDFFSQASSELTYLIRNRGTESPIPLPISARILSMVIDYVSYHHLENPRRATIHDAEFINAVHQDHQSTLTQLAAAACYLDIQGLVNLTCRRVADSLVGLTKEEVIEKFNIK